MLKKVLKGLLTAVLFFSVIYYAWANWNIRQNADGTTDWVDENGAESRIGTIYLTIGPTDLGAAATYNIASPITGYVVRIMAVLGATGADITTSLTGWVMSTVTPGNYIRITPYGALFIRGNSTGRVSFARFFTRTLTRYATVFNFVGEGGLIGISTGGEATQNLDGTIIITLDRKQRTTNLPGAVQDGGL